MYCINCGKAIADESAFCEFCGAKQIKVEPATSAPVANVAPSNETNPNESKTEKPKKKKKVGLVVTFASLALLLAAGAVWFFCFRKSNLDISIGGENMKLSKEKGLEGLEKAEGGVILAKYNALKPEATKYQSDGSSTPVEGIYGVNYSLLGSEVSPDKSNICYNNGVIINGKIDFKLPNGISNTSNMEDLANAGYVYMGKMNGFWLTLDADGNVIKPSYIDDEFKLFKENTNSYPYTMNGLSDIALKDPSYDNMVDYIRNNQKTSAPEEYIKQILLFNKLNCEICGTHILTDQGQEKFGLESYDGKRVPENVTPSRDCYYQIRVYYDLRTNRIGKVQIMMMANKALSNQWRKNYGLPTIETE